MQIKQNICLNDMSDYILRMVWLNKALFTCKTSSVSKQKYVFSQEV